MAAKKRNTTIPGRMSSKLTQAMGKIAENKETEKAGQRVVNNILIEALERKLPGYEVGISYAHDTDGILIATPSAGGLAFHGESIGVPGDVEGEVTPQGTICLLMESKRSLHFSDPGDRGARDIAKVAAQGVHYLHNIKAGSARGASGSNKATPPVPYPQVLIIHDEDEIFYIATAFLTKYVNGEYNWGIAPSSASEKDMELFLALRDDSNLNLAVDHLDERFDLNSFMDRVINAALGNESEKLHVSPENLEPSFLEYQRLAFGGQAINPKTQMAIFLMFLLGDENIYLHPNKKNVVVIGHRDHKGKEKTESYPERAGEIFSSAGHERFWLKYQRGEYGYDATKALTEVGDSIIEELDRRFTGDYWTPAIWVREAHRMIEEQLGDDWKENYVVWDPAAGTKNLTRDYRFKELYSSTLDQGELSVASSYNPEGTAFQYDFLNDDIALHDAGQGLFAKKPGEMREKEKEAFLEEQRGKWKLPDGLIEALVYNKPIVFLANPPYGQNGNNNRGNARRIKGGVATNETGRIMMENGMKGHATRELYTQFIYRTMQLADVFGYTGNFHIFMFTKCFITSPSYAAFTTALKNGYKYLNGFMMNAGEFQGTSSAWGIIFTGWEKSANGTADTPLLSVRRTTMNSQAQPIVETVGTWKAMAIESGSMLRTLIIDPSGSKQTKGRYPTTKNGFEITDGVNYSSYTDQAIGYLHNDSDTIQKSHRGTALFSMAYNHGMGRAIEHSNIHSITTLFSIRKAMYARVAREGLLWVRDKDVFPVPTKAFQASDEWGSFTTDCIIYSLFVEGSNQTSLRDYEYGVEADGVTPKKWRVENQFYWLSRETTKELAIKNKLPAIERDLATDSERYVYSYLKSKRDEGELSSEAEALLSKATEIHAASFKYRELYNDEVPSHNLLTWDAGWLQLQRMSYGRDALPFAKNDDELQALYGEFKFLRAQLGESIATRYSEDTGF